MGKKLLLLLIAVLIVASSVFIYFRKKPDLTYIKASGTVEVTQIQLSPLVGGRIIDLPIKEAQPIKKGDLVARMSLDGADDDVKMAEAALVAAKAQLAELQNGFRSEDKAKAQAEYNACKIKYQQAERDRVRFAKLAAEGVVAKRDAELYEEAAKAKQSSMRAAEEQVRLLKNGIRPETIEAAKANVARAESAYKKAQTLISYKEFFSPADGVVLTKNYEIGDVVASGAPIGTIGDINDAWVKLYIPASQLGRIKLGAKCHVKVDPYPDKSFEGTVTEVNQQAEYNPRMSLTQSQRENMVFWIKISIGNSNGIIKPGMPADVTIK